MGGITDKEVFGNLLRTLALSRKTLRFWKPVKAVKRIEDLYADPARDQLDKNLTALEIGSDAVYAAIDHVTFLQRIGALKWMRPKQVDNLDRFLEFFWATECVPVIGEKHVIFSAFVLKQQWHRKQMPNATRTRDVLLLPARVQQSLPRIESRRVYYCSKQCVISCAHSTSCSL